jgi:thiol-disulfide isomerase/thioredoxin
MKSIRSRSLASLIVAAFSLACLQVVHAEGGFKPFPAPAWTLQDVDGKPVSSSQLQGKVVVLDFWATWCGPCRSEIPGYVELQKKYGDAGLAIVGVSLDRGSGAQQLVKKFIEEQKINYQIVVGDDKIADAFGGVDAIPTTFIIDRGGTVRFSKQGAMDHEEFEAILKPFLKP